MNNLDPLTRQRVIAALARVQPTSVYQLGTVSRSMRNETANKQRQLTALKHLVRRKVARIRHFESPIQVGGQRTRLRSALFNAKRTAFGIARLNPMLKKVSRRARRVFAARKAYEDYQKNAGNWNRFVRINAKIGLGNGLMTKEKARRMYGY